MDSYPAMLRRTLCLLFFSASSQSAGISPYLPLQLSPEIEQQVEKVMALTRSAPLSKPYKAVDVLNRLDEIKASHPVLYTRVSSYLERYKKPFGVTHWGAEIAFSNDTTKALPNQRNLKAETRVQVSGAGYVNLSPYAYIAAGGVAAEGEGVIASNTHIAFGFEYAQMEVGYREHWFSPFQDSAMLVSTHAKASPSITISNATPITSWGIRYEVFYSVLEPAEGIRLGDDVFPGRPRHAGLHLSIAPLDNWTIGFNRTLQFGGGERSVDFSDFFEALFDPAGKDNVDNAVVGDPNFEFGNQQASITTKWNFELFTPISLYAELAGEDTVDQSNFKLGNQATSYGVFLPALTDKISLRYEFSDWSDAWYVHPLYQEGYTNDGQVLGHWAGGERLLAFDTPGQAHSANLNWNITNDSIIDISARLVNNEENNGTTYETGYELDVRYSRVTRYGMWGVGVYVGKDVFGDQFGRVSTFLRW